MSIVLPMSERLLKVAGDIPTPAIVYDLDAIEHTVTQLRRDLSQVENFELCFAVKANRCQSVLLKMAELGLGADIATTQELEAASIAGLSPIYATAPAFSVSELKQLVSCGVVPDLSSLSQLRVWCEHIGGGQPVGLRLRLPISKSDRDSSLPSPWSRFGIDPLNPELHELIQTYELEVVHLHVHTGELRSQAVVRQLIDTLLTCCEIFPNVEVLNLGGGLTYLYADRAEAQRAWEAVAQAVATTRKDKPNWRLVLEPGMLLTVMAGYLVSEVRAADEHFCGHRLVVLDTSAWNLMSWAPTRIVGQIPVREGAMVEHDFAGCTCYENDYFLLGEKMTKIEVGDRIIFSAAGAYVSSMARYMHGLPLPQEWILDGNQLQRVGES